MKPATLTYETVSTEEEEEMSDLIREPADHEEHHDQQYDFSGFFLKTKTHFSVVETLAWSLWSPP